MAENPDRDPEHVINDAAEFAPWLSRHILTNTGHVLGDVIGTAKGEIDEYITILAEIADTSGGGLTDPPQAVGDCPDWEDNRILDLALAVPDAPGADITVKPPNQTIPAQPWISLGF